MIMIKVILKQIVKSKQLVQLIYINRRKGISAKNTSDSVSSSSR